jgi:hypothetical protein
MGLEPGLFAGAVLVQTENGEVLRSIHESFGGQCNTPQMAL